MILVAIMVTTSAQANFTYTETFKDSSATGWKYAQGSSNPGPRLTSGATAASQDPESGTLDSVGDGWLRLTTLTGNQANVAYFDQQVIPTDGEVIIEFDYTMWKNSGSRADGFCFFLYDSSVAFSAGGFGGSLGYAQRSGIEGLAGGYIGVGFDEWGNFCNPTEGRNGGIGFYANSVTVRGPGQQDGSNNWTQGYPFIASTGAYAQPLSFNSSTRPSQTGGDYRRARIVIDENNLLTVSVQFGANSSFVTLITEDYSGYTRPNGLHMGFTGSTGGVNSVIEIRNLSVTVSPSSSTPFWDNDLGNGVWGTASNENTNWVGDTNPADGAQVYLTDSYISSSQSIDLQNSNKVVSDITFGGTYSYSIGSTEGRQLRFNTGNGSTSSLNLALTSSGSADHSIDTLIQTYNKLQITNYTPNKLTLASIRNRGNDITIVNSGTIEFSDQISGGGALAKSGSGNLLFTTATNNTHRGGNLFTGGTITLATPDGTDALGNSDTVANNVTMEWQGNEQLRDPKNLSVSNTTLNLNGYSDSLSDFELAGNSTLNLGNGNSIFSMSSFTYTSGTLNIYNWSGSLAGGGTDQVTVNSTFTSNLDKIRFYSDAGSTFLATAKFVGNELVPDMPLPVPATPANLLAISPTATSIDLSWGSVLFAESYKIDVATDKAFTQLLTGYNDLDTGGVATSLTVTGLSTNTVYYFRVRAHNTQGTSSSSPILAFMIRSLPVGADSLIAPIGIATGTVDNVFGAANEIGVAASDTYTTATQILVVDSTGATTNTYFYNNTTNQWEDVTFAYAGGNTIPAGSGFVFRNNTASVDYIVLDGVPNSSSGSNVTISTPAPGSTEPVYNLVSHGSTEPIQIQDLNLNPGQPGGFLGGRSISQVDKILIIDPNTGATTSYYYLIHPTNPARTGWYDQDRQPAGTMTIDPSEAFYIRTAPGSTFTDWTLP